MDNPKNVSSWGIWDIKSGETWVKIAGIVGAGWLLKSWILPTLDEILRLVNSIAWNTVEGLVAGAIIAVLTAPLWNKNLRTILFNSIDILSYAAVKAFVGANPVGWLEKQKNDLDAFIDTLSTTIQEFRGQISVLVKTHHENKGKIENALDRHEASSDNDVDIREIEEQLRKMDVEEGEVDEAVFDRYEQALALQGDSEIAAVQAVSLRDHNREIASLITDLRDIWQFMIKLKQDATTLSGKMGNDINLYRIKRKTTGSVWKLLKQARKFTADGLRQQLTEYAKQVINQDYANAIGQFKAIAIQGDQLLREARSDTRVASRTAKQLAQKFRQARAAAGPAADHVAGAGHTVSQPVTEHRKV